MGAMFLRKKRLRHQGGWKPPNGSVGDHIRTGKRYLAHEHFKTLPDTKKGNGVFKSQQKKLV